MKLRAANILEIITVVRDFFADATMFLPLLILDVTSHLQESVPLNELPIVPGLIPMSLNAM